MKSVCDFTRRGLFCNDFILKYKPLVKQKVQTKSHDVTLNISTNEWKHFCKDNLLIEFVLVLTRDLNITIYSIHKIIIYQSTAAMRWSANGLHILKDPHKIYSISAIE